MVCWLGAPVLACRRRRHAVDVPYVVADLALLILAPVVLEPHGACELFLENSPLGVGALCGRRERSAPDCGLLEAAEAAEARGQPAYAKRMPACAFVFAAMAAVGSAAAVYGIGGSHGCAGQEREDDLHLQVATTTTVVVVVVMKMMTMDLGDESKDAADYMLLFISHTRALMAMSCNYRQWQEHAHPG